MLGRLMILASSSLALLGCQQMLGNPEARTDGQGSAALPPTLARLQRAYPDLASGRFVCLADFNTLPQAALFRTLRPDGAEADDQPAISVRHSIDETGAGGLRARLSAPELQLLFDGERSAKLALLRDWRKYNLLLFDIYGPPDGLMLEFTVRSGTDTPLRSTRQLFAEPGWQLYRVDLAEVGEEIDLADVRALCWRAPQLTAPVDLYFDDFILTDNTRYLSGQDAEPGELYLKSAGRRLIVGARDRFELAFADGVVVEWHAGDEHNLTVRSGLGPWPVPLPENWSQRQAEPVVYDDPALWAAWGERIVATQRVVEQSEFRIVLEGVWRFLHKPDEIPTEPTPAPMPEHSWRYAIYPSGQVYVQVSSRAQQVGWPGARVGYAVALDGRSGFERVAPEMAHREAGDTNFVLMSQPDRQRPDLLWSIQTPAAAERQLGLVSADARRVAVTVGDLEPGQAIATAHSLRFWPWDIDAAPEAQSLAADYQHPATLTVACGQVVDDAAGDLDRDGFNESEGCYELALGDGLSRFTLQPGVLLRHQPIFRVRGTAGRQCWVYADGRIIDRQGRDEHGELMFGLPRPISAPLTIEVNTRVAGAVP
jgi:hypothetical protein